MSLKIKLETKHPIAYESLDYKNPHGTKANNSKNIIFNRKINKIYNNNSINILDLGCSGGGFVKDCIDDGHIAVGLEGSDYSKKHSRAEWRTIPNFLFTCDITKPFTILQEDVKMKFHLITAWEVMEHIEEKDFPELMNNVKNHLYDNGLCIFSISLVDDIINGVNLHRTVKNKKWWYEMFKSHNFFILDGFKNYFNEQYIRGKKYGAPNTFHVILSLNKDKAPLIPKLTMRQKIADYIIGTRFQRMVKNFVLGEY